MIISVQNQKGGVGKTTLAIHISYVLSSSNKRVLLIDAVPQGSSRDWQQQEKMAYGNDS